MKTSILYTCIFIMMALGENLCGQSKQSDAEHTEWRILKSAGLLYPDRLSDTEYIEWQIEELEDKRKASLFDRLGLKEGDKNKKNEKKRCIISIMKFEKLPDNLMFHGIHSDGVNENTFRSIIHPNFKNNTADYVDINELYRGYSTTIFFDDKCVGSIGIEYMNSQYYARRKLVSNLQHLQSKPFEREDVTFPKGIGDDYCIRNDYSQSVIFFIRDYVVFEIRSQRTKGFDVEKLAKYIDEKFFESNKKLNEK